MSNSIVFTSVPVKSVQKATEELEERKEKCFDLNLETPREIAIMDDGEHVQIPSLFGDDPVRLSGVAKNNIATMIDIAPKTLWDRYAGKHLDLRLETVRRFIPETFDNSDKRIFGRFRSDVDGEGNQYITARALLSEIYHPIDDLDVFVSVLNALSETGYVELRDMDSFEEAMYARFLLPDEKLEINGKPCVAGVRLSNSEVGFSATHIVPAVVFPNGSGLTFPNDSAQIHKVHKGTKNSDPQKTLKEICDDIPEIVKSLKTYLYALQDFEDFEIVDPDALFDILEKDFKANKERVSKKTWKGARLAFQELSAGLNGTGRVTGINIIEAIASAPLYVKLPYAEMLYIEELCSKLVTGYGRNKTTLLTILKN